MGFNSKELFNDGNGIANKPPLYLSPKAVNLLKKSSGLILFSSKMKVQRSFQIYVLYNQAFDFKLSSPKVAEVPMHTRLSPSN